MHDHPILSHRAIAGEILVAHEAATSAARSVLDHARRAGDLLISVKAETGHGAWLPWLAANLPSLSARTCQAYMRVARGWSRLANPQPTADLTLAGALAQLAAPRTWTPPEGAACFVAGNGAEIPDVWLWPACSVGHWYVSVLRAANGVRWGLVDAMTRPVAGHALPTVVAHLAGAPVDLSAARWIAGLPPEATNWLAEEWSRG